MDDEIIIKVILIRALRLFSNARSNDIPFIAIAAISGGRLRDVGRRTRCKSALVTILNRVSLVTAVLRHLGATLTLLRANVARSFMFEGLSSTPSFVLVSNLHCLVELVLDDFSRGRLDAIECDGCLFRGALRLKSLTLLCDVVLGASRECLSHVGIPLVFLIDQMVGGRYVVVTIRF